MGKQPFQKSGRGRYRPRGPRKNDRIRVPEIRVIGQDGAQIGIMPTREALLLAKRAGLDLVEISPTARPPVCRILDFGKYKYELSKKNKDKNHSTHRLKEIKFRVRTDQHDYITKLRHGEDFLDKGSKLKITLMFRGREMEHTELGFEVINRAIKDLEHIGTPDAKPRLVGRSISLTMSPLPENKKKLVFNVPLEKEQENSEEQENSDTAHQQANPKDFMRAKPFS